MLALATEGVVVRLRRPRPARRPPKALWVAHRATCVFAPGCEPMATLVERVSERGVLGRIKAGIIARCVTCQPVLVERRDEP